MDEFKQRQRAMWAAGDYATLSEFIRDVGERVVARVGVDAGMRCSMSQRCGNAAIPAARARGAGSTSFPSLTRRRAPEGGGRRCGDRLDRRRRRDARRSGRGLRRSVLDVRAHVRSPASADGRRDGLVSHKGGVVALCCWTPESPRGGARGRLLHAAAAGLRLPDNALGKEEYVRAMFALAASAFDFEHHSTVIEAESIEGFSACCRAPDRWSPRNELSAHGSRASCRDPRDLRHPNTASNGEFVLAQEYRRFR